MLTVVTDAGGFVGRSLVARMTATSYPGTIRLVDRASTIAQGPAHSHEAVAADLTDPDARAAALAGAAADRLGFRRDGGIDALVARGLAGLARGA